MGRAFVAAAAAGTTPARANARPAPKNRFMRVDARFCALLPAGAAAASFCYGVGARIARPSSPALAKAPPCRKPPSPQPSTPSTPMPARCARSGRATCSREIRRAFRSFPSRSTIFCSISPSTRSRARRSPCWSRSRRRAISRAGARRCFAANRLTTRKGAPPCIWGCAIFQTSRSSCRASICGARSRRRASGSSPSRATSARARFWARAISLSRIS